MATELFTVHSESSRQTLDTPQMPLDTQVNKSPMVIIAGWNSLISK